MQEQQVKFGLDQIAKRTPAFAQWIFRAVLYMAAIVNIILTVVVEIPEEVRLIVGKYSIYAVTLVHAFSKLFGIEVSGPSDYYNQGNK